MSAYIPASERAAFALFRAKLMAGQRPEHRQVEEALTAFMDSARKLLIEKRDGACSQAAVQTVYDTAVALVESISCASPPLSIPRLLRSFYRTDSSNKICAAPVLLHVAASVLDWIRDDLLPQGAVHEAA